MFVPTNLEVKPSPVDGLGLFATADILTNQYLGEWTGVKFNNRAEFEAKYGKDYRYTYYSPFPWNPIWSCKDDRNFITYINHADTPNVYLKSKKLYALAPIPKGSELFLKYPSKKLFMPSSQ